MTSLAITSGAMTSIASKAGPQAGARRDVVVAWAMAVVLASALVLTVPSHDEQGPSGSPLPLASAAGQIHPKAADSEGPSSDETCSDRDYANERC